MLNIESKLNPLAEEFVPSSRRRLSASAPAFFPCGHLPFPLPVAPVVAPRPQPLLSPPQREASRAGSTWRDIRAEKAAKIKRTVYVSDIDPRITEGELVKEFSKYGVVKGSLICGNTRSGLHFGFIEFEKEDSARSAIGLNCTRIGLYPVRVSPSRTSIVPISRIRN